MPSLSVSKFNSVLQPRENIVIFCNITEGKPAFRTRLWRISWFNDEMLMVSSGWCPPPEPILTMNVANKRFGIGGNYTCLVEVLLRHVKPYNLSGNTMIESEC